MCASQKRAHIEMRSTLSTQAPRASAKTPRMARKPLSHETIWLVWTSTSPVPRTRPSAACTITQSGLVVPNDTLTGVKAVFAPGNDIPGILDVNVPVIGKPVPQGQKQDEKHKQGYTQRCCCGFGHRSNLPVQYRIQIAGKPPGKNIPPVFVDRC